jgi:hypothetical protein
VDKVADQPEVTAQLSQPVTFFAHPPPAWEGLFEKAARRGVRVVFVTCQGGASTSPPHELTQKSHRILANTNFIAAQG